MPSEFYQMAACGMPIGFGGLPVRPLGKVLEYDDLLQRVLDDCATAIAQGSLQLPPSAGRNVDPTLQTASLVLGVPAGCRTPPTPNSCFPSSARSRRLQDSWQELDEDWTRCHQQLGSNTREVAEDSIQASPEDDELQSARRLSRLHNLVVAEFLDPTVLAEMSVPDVLKLRTRAWGAAGEHRDQLGRELRRIGRTTRSDDDFDQACRSALEEYRRARADWNNEAAQLRIKLIADLGKIAISGLVGQFGSELAQEYVQLGSLEALLFVGGMLFLKAAGERVPEFQALIHQLRERDNLPGCALAKLYDALLTKRRRSLGSQFEIAVLLPNSMQHPDVVRDSPNSAA